MELTGTFEFSHVEMVVVNKKDVYRKTIVGEKKKVILWHKEHCPKVYLPEDIKLLIQGYLKSKWHRVSPSGNTINIYHKTKKELKAEWEAKEAEKQDGRCCCPERKNERPFGIVVEAVAGRTIKPGSLVSIRTR